MVVTNKVRGGQIALPHTQPGNSQEAVFLIRVPVRVFLLERRRIRLPPKRMVPGHGLQSIVAGLKHHGCIGRFVPSGIEFDRDLASGIGPVAKGSDRPFAHILGHGGRTVRPQAHAERGAGRAGRVRRIRSFGTIDPGIMRKGGAENWSRYQCQNRDGTGETQGKVFGSSHSVLIIALAGVEGKMQ